MSTFRIEWDSNIVKSALRTAAQSGSYDSAKHVARIAKSFAPTGNRQYSGAPGGKSWQSRKPGRLKNTISAQKSKFKNGGAIVVAGDEDAFYARFVALGTPGSTRKLRSSRGARRSSTRTPIKANPFMTNALKASRSVIVGIIEKELAKRLKK